jgi:hypothetical protein
MTSNIWSGVTQTERTAKSLGRKEHNLQMRAHLDSERNDFEKVRQKQMKSERELLQASRPKDKPFECPICSDKCTNEDISRVDTCGHGICRACMRNYVTAEIEKRRWPIICPLCRAQPQRSLAPGGTIISSIRLNGILI